jgi:transcriptional regulator with XRE-family HTH domain
MNNTKETKYLKAFGKRLSEVRKSRGLTQEQLAEMANITSLSISYIEQGRRWPRLLTLHKLSSCLNVSVAELFKNL